ncbi:MAG: TPM domain-containing protein [Rhodocyclaceae bacterium]|nr:TPM domain-containing protein [Rhodocyclaceae bacterium]
MAPIVRLIAALGLFLLGAVAQAADALVAVPPLMARVTDLTGTLSRDKAASLEAGLARFERERGSQIAILLVPTTQPEAIEAYSIRVAEAWKLGRKGIDDGILILVARNDRKLRIEVGRGLEGAVPDAVAKRIVAETIGPRFKEGDFFGGLQTGVAKLQAVIAGEALPAPKSSSPASAAAMDLETLFIVSMVIATMLGAVMNRWFGRLGGSTVTSGVVGGLAWLVTGSLLAAIAGAILVFIFVLAFASSGRGGGWSSGGWSGGGGGGGWGGSSDGGFSGGGGDFGGGGASGDW